MMKQLKLVALFLAAMLCLSACGGNKQPGENTPESTPAVEKTDSQSPDDVDVADKPLDPSIPTAVTEKAPTKEGETYQAVGMYLGMADNNLMVIIEANPEDGKPEKSYKISPEIDLNEMGITEGSMVDITYTVDENGIKQVQSVSTQH